MPSSRRREWISQGLLKKLAAARNGRLDAVMRGMTGHRSNAFEAMNVLLEEAKRVASGFRNDWAFVVVARLRRPKISRLAGYPLSPLGAV